MIKKIFIFIFAALILNVSCEDDNSLDPSKNQQKIYQFTKFTLSIENVSVNEHLYTYTCFPPDYEIITSNEYRTYSKTFKYSFNLKEEYQNNRGDTISYNDEEYYVTDTYKIDFIFNKEDATITHFKYNQYEVDVDGDWDITECDMGCNISKLKYDEKDNIIEAYVDSPELMDALTGFEHHINVSGHYWESTTEYTILNTTDNSRIKLTLEMAE